IHSAFIGSVALIGISTPARSRATTQGVHMNTLLMISIDLAAIALVTLGLYHRRHGRRDLVTAFVVVNTGVFAVTLLLASADIGLGVGLGLFGVLSIIRLRSSEISHTEFAYYFASLALGLDAGVETDDLATFSEPSAVSVAAITITH